MSNVDFILNIVNKSFLRCIYIYLDDEESENPKVEKLSSEEKQDLKDEFLLIMQERFLIGQDKGFDYRFDHLLSAMLMHNMHAYRLVRNQVDDYYIAG